ncbi:MAG: Gfo/Idh/MocA family oxidoreductase [Candidatus Hydrogenedentes bacterium]|nr:Gfo/Idh/MocA family oxidoreductase [Candidatus Hydrogenedentota bacterium]
MGHSDRRAFLKYSTCTAAAALAGPFIAASRASANDRIRAAVVGVRGRGVDHMSSLNRLGKANVELVAICDCYENTVNERAGQFEKQFGKKLRTCIDMRDIFADKDIDVVTFAIPNHWHALATIWACEAGKDVYIEKPAAHTIEEGRRMVETARKHKRIVQVGTQCRSSANIAEGIRKLHEGVIGEVYMARGIAFKLRDTMGHPKDIPVPESLDWDLWLGPAADRPYADIWYYQWNNFWDFGDGQIGNQGVHQIDVMRWGLKLDSHASMVQSMGGALVHDEYRETPNMQSASWTFDGRKTFAQFEVRQWYTTTEAGMGDEYPFVDGESVVGVTFFGSDGFMIIPDYSSYHTFMGAKRTPGPSNSDPKNPMGDLPHFENFINAVRSRKHEDLNADIEEGHLGAAMFHLANIAYRTGKTLRFDPKTERFTDDDANRLLGRTYRPPYTIH